MGKAMTAKQLNFSVPNKVGLLCDLTCALADAKINIEAICAYEMEDKAYFMLVTDNNAKAKKLISQSMDAEVKVEDVIAVEMPNRAGQLEKVAEKIAEAGIDIQYLYGSPGKGKSATLIFKTDNDRKALKAIA